MKNQQRKHYASQIVHQDFFMSQFCIVSGTTALKNNHILASAKWKEKKGPFALWI